MCTVVFIPGKQNIFLGSLRDEDPQRPQALPPEIFTEGDTSYLAPKDPVARGTWVGVSSAGNAVVLLNGGFKNHPRETYYRKSRGLIVTQLLASEMPIEKWNCIDTEDTEPFTVIVWGKKCLFQLVWDGSKKHSIRLDVTLPYIWSSSTLYNADSKLKRIERFQNWISMCPVVSEISLLNFFKTYTDSEDGFIMNRNDTVKTLSFSFIMITENQSAVFSYSDISINSYSIREIELLDKPGNREPICNPLHNSMIK